MNQLKIFENAAFGKVRVIMRDEEPWFVAKDVAEALGYASPKDAVAAHCNYAELFRGGDLPPLASNPYGIKIIPESDVYAMIFHSNLPAAERFRHWACEEVLPTIRKTGSYGFSQVTKEDAILAAARAGAKAA